jgi:hypothetical protein
MASPLTTLSSTNLARISLAMRLSVVMERKERSSTTVL